MSTNNYNENYIREAAYYLWQNAGCPSGQDEKFWSMAVEQYSSYSSKKSCCCKTGSSCSSSSKKTSTTTSTKSCTKSSGKK